jgi:hypothetical protein
MVASIASGGMATAGTKEFTRADWAIMASQSSENATVVRVMARIILRYIFRFEIVAVLVLPVG